MKAQELFDLALREGMKADYRGEEELQRKLDRERKKFEKLTAQEKELFDTDKLTDPYLDGGLHYVSKENPEVKKVLAGIDIDVGEVLLADKLKEKGSPIDLIIAHHPIGTAIADLDNVMDMQEEYFHQMGVPIHIAENLMAERRDQVKRGIHPLNHQQSVDAAKLLDISIMNMHTQTDNMVWRFLQEKYDNLKPHTVGDVLDVLKEIPEYQFGFQNSAGPRIIAGRPDNRAGRVMVDMTGGTNPHEDIYEQLSRYGVSTVVGMHAKEPTIKKMKKHKLNVIIAGHYASDSLGMNLMLDKFEAAGVEIVPCSGLIRVSRN
jgi:putative NIF3 family GTP cyclohydrolase 1 type 2